MGKRGRPKKVREPNPSPTPAPLQGIIVPFGETTTTTRRSRPRKAKEIVLEKLKRCSHLNTKGSNGSFHRKQPKRVTSCPKETIVPLGESTTTKRRGRPRKGKEILLENLKCCSHLITTGSGSSFNQKQPRRVTSRPKISRPKRKDHCLRQATSLGFSDIAATLADDSPDPDEVDSMLDTSLVKVDEYIVKKETAPLLKSILDKQGDIAMNCFVETTTNRSSLLENVCGLYKKLEKKDHKSIKVSEVKSMLVEVGDFEKAGLDVKWLKERLEDIAGALEELKSYAVMKEEVERNKEDGERKRKEVEELKEKTRVAENELAAIEAKGTELSERMSSTKAKWESVCGQSLVKGLL